MADIELHPEKGVNPFLTYCRRCKGEAPEIVLVGRNDGIYQCSAGLSEGGPHKMIGRPRPNMDNALCEECGFNTRWSRVGTLEEGQRIQSRQPCDPCMKEIEEHRKVVEAGGLYFECRDCKAKGAIKPEAKISKAAREHYQREENKKTPIQDGWYTKPIHNKGNELVYLPIGVAFTKEDCPACGPDRELHNPTKPT